MFSQHALDLLRSAGEVLHPEPGEVLWDAGDPYDLYLVLAGGVLLVDHREDRVVFVIEEGDFVGELGMLMGQRAFLPGIAMEETAVLSRQCATDGPSNAAETRALRLQPSAQFGDLDAAPLTEPKTESSTS